MKFKRNSKLEQKLNEKTSRVNKTARTFQIKENEIARKNFENKFCEEYVGTKLLFENNKGEQFKVIIGNMSYNTKKTTRFNDYHLTVFEVRDDKEQNRFMFLDKNPKKRNSFIISPEASAKFIKENKYIPIPESQKAINILLQYNRRSE